MNEAQMYRLANEFGISWRQAKKALEAANGDVTLAIDEILLSPELDIEEQEEEIPPNNKDEPQISSKKQSLNESDESDELLDTEGESKTNATLYDALVLEDSSASTAETEPNIVTNALSRGVQQKTREVWQMLTAVVAFPTFPSLVRMLHEFMKAEKQKDLEILELYIDWQQCNDQRLTTRGRPKEVEWTCRRQAAMFTKMRKRQGETFSLGFIYFERYLRSLEKFDWNKLCLLPSSVALVIPTVETLEVFFEALVESYPGSVEEDKLNVIVLKSFYLQLERPKRRLLRQSLDDPYSSIFLFPDNCLDSDACEVPWYLFEQCSSEYPSEIQAAYILTTIKPHCTFILNNKESVTVHYPNVANGKGELFVLSITEYAQTYAARNKRFQQFVSALQDSVVPSGSEQKELDDSLNTDDRIDEETDVYAKQTLSGVFRVQPNRKFAKVSSVVISREYFGRALHGDRVVIEVSWTNNLKRGKVIAVTERRTEPFVATLYETSSSEDGIEDTGEEGMMRMSSHRSGHLFAPMDRRLPLCMVFGRNLEQYKNHRVVLRFRCWRKSSQYPEAYLVDKLGPVGNVDAETMAVLVGSGVRDFKYPLEAFKEIDVAPNMKTLANELPTTVCWDKRLDIRDSRLVFSIDPPGSTDIDDALSVFRITENIYEIGVHIADFSAWIPSGCFIDVEAMKRGTSVYLVDRRISMVPSVLSENLCSLRANYDRLSVSVFFFVDVSKDAELVDISEHLLDKEFIKKTVKSEATKGVYFARCILRSIGELHYNNVDHFLAGDIPSLGTINDNEVQQNIRLLTKIAGNFLQKRIQAGALTNLNSGELRFELDDQRNVHRVVSKTDLEIMSVVAEMMIAANSFVASQLLACCPNEALLRRHSPPPLEKISQFMSTTASLGISMLSNETPTSETMTISSESFIVGLEEQLETASRDSSPLSKLVSSLATRAMSEAEYFSAGVGGDIRHFALGLDAYTHFTSPIRRYPDVIVHRALLRVTGLQETEQDSLPPYYPGGLEDLAEHLNVRHREAKKASEMSNALFFSLFFRSQQGLVTDALIVSIDTEPEFALNVFLPRYSLYGTVSLLDSTDKRIILPASNVEFYRKEESSEWFVNEEDCKMSEPLWELCLAEDRNKLVIIDKAMENQVIVTWTPGNVVKVGVWSSYNRYREPGIRMLLASRSVSPSSSPSSLMEHKQSTTTSFAQRNRHTKPKESVVKQVISSQTSEGNVHPTKEAHQGIFRIWNLRARLEPPKDSMYAVLDKYISSCSRKIREAYTFTSNMAY
eukprot:jgi/Galph1/4531/GphlegSOOS_G3191.1